MIRKAAFALGLCGLVATSLSAQRLPLAVPEEVGLSSERLQRIGEVFQGYVDEGRIAGGVGMVLRQGRLAYVDAWGMRDITARDTMEEDDIFKICSMSKPVASVAVMTLYEEGLFFLSDPIGRYLPELANLRVANLAEASAGQDIPTERARRPVTIHDMLRHTAGFTYGDLSNTVVDGVYREEEILYPETLEEMVDPAQRDPAALPARNAVALQRFSRRARSTRRSPFGADVRCLLAGADFRSPRYGRYRFPGAGLEARSCRTDLWACGARPDARTGRYLHL